MKCQLILQINLLTFNSQLTWAQLFLREVSDTLPQLDWPSKNKGPTIRPRKFQPIRLVFVDVENVPHGKRGDSNQPNTDNYDD